MMKLSFALMTAVVSSTALALPPQPVKIQTPCMIDGHAREQACVVVKQFLRSNGSTVSAYLDVSKGKALPNQPRVYSVIYRYQLTPDSYAPQGNIEVSSNQYFPTEKAALTDKNLDHLHVLTTNVSKGDDIYVWRTTRDGGKTWSDIRTDQTDTMGG